MGKLLDWLNPLKPNGEFWLRGVDLNHRPLGYEPNELPDCSTPQFDDSNRVEYRQTCALGGEFRNGSPKRTYRIGVCGVRLFFLRNSS